MTAEEFHKQWRPAGQLTDYITAAAACVFAEAYARIVSPNAAEALGEQGVSGMSEDMKAHRRKAFAPDEVEAIEKEHEHSWLKKQAELEDNANCCIGCPPTEADFKALAAPADDGMYEACAKVRELHTRSLSSGTGKIIICMCSICETFKAWQKSNHLTAAEAPGGQRAEGCSCGSHDLAPLYHHPKCTLAPAAPSGRADAPSREPHNGWLNMWMFKNVPRDQNANYLWDDLALKMAGDWADFRAGLSSQEGK